MNEGVKILLARMETNPEEFVPEYEGGITKWGVLIQSYKRYLSEEDNKALEEAWEKTVNERMKERFTEAVMRELLAPETNTQGELGLGYKQHEQQVAHQIARMKALQATQAQLLPGSITYTSEPLVHKKPTIFGKLFNYT